METENDLPLMKGPAIYRIRISGRLDSSSSDRLESMNITELRQPNGEMESILVGRLDDQSALVGVLNTLHELHLPVLSAECLERG